MAWRSLLVAVLVVVRSGLVIRAPLLVQPCPWLRCSGKLSRSYSPGSYAPSRNWIPSFRYWWHCAPPYVRRARKFLESAAPVSWNHSCVEAASEKKKLTPTVPCVHVRRQISARFAGSPTPSPITARRVSYLVCTRPISTNIAVSGRSVFWSRMCFHVDGSRHNYNWPRPLPLFD